MAEKHYSGRRAQKIEGVSFKPDAYEGLTEQQFIDKGLRDKTFERQFPGNEAKQKELLRATYNHLFPKKNPHQGSVQEGASTKGD